MLPMLRYFVLWSFVPSIDTATEVITHDDVHVRIENSCNTKNSHISRRCLHEARQFHIRISQKHVQSVTIIMCRTKCDAIQWKRAGNCYTLNSLLIIVAWFVTVNKMLTTPTENLEQHKMRDNHDGRAMILLLSTSSAQYYYYNK